MAKNKKTKKNKVERISASEDKLNNERYWKSDENWYSNWEAADLEEKKLDEKSNTYYDWYDKSSAEEIAAEFEKIISTDEQKAEHYMAKLEDAIAQHTKEYLAAKRRLFVAKQALKQAYLDVSNHKDDN